MWERLKEVGDVRVAAVQEALKTQADQTASLPLENVCAFLSALQAPLLLGERLVLLMFIL